MATVKKMADDMKEQVMDKLSAGQKRAEKEIAKMRKQFEGVRKTVEGYVRKNPDKAALISAGVGAALGAAAALLVGGKRRGKK